MLFVETYGCFLMKGIFNKKNKYQPRKSGIICTDGHLDL